MASKEQIQAENAKIAEKHFDYAESIIKEWLAEYLNVPVANAFPDYTDHSDVLGFKSDGGKYYTAYLVTLKNNTPVQLDTSELKPETKFGKAVGIMLDAVNVVFGAILSTIEPEFSDRVINLRPILSSETMSFNLKYINIKALQLQQAVQRKHQINMYLSGKAKELEENKTAESISAEDMQKINGIVDQCDQIIKSIPKSTLDSEQEKCTLENEKMTRLSSLYLVIEENTQEEDTAEESNDVLNDVSKLEESLQRLPTFGLPYQDPTQENYIDKIKKEYQVQE